MPLIETSQDGAVGTIALDHGKKRNALSKDLVAAIVEALEGCALVDVRVVVLRARPGAKVWSAGHDVDELPQAPRSARLGRPASRARAAGRRVSSTCDRDNRRRRVGRSVRIRVRMRSCCCGIHLRGHPREARRSLAGAHPMSPRRFERMQGLRRIVYDSDDYAEGIRAFREQRARDLLAVETFERGHMKSAIHLGDPHGRAQEHAQTRR